MIQTADYPDAIPAWARDSDLFTVHELDAIDFEVVPTLHWSTEQQIATAPGYEGAESSAWVIGAGQSPMIFLNARGMSMNTPLPPDVPRHAWTRDRLRQVVLHECAHLVRLAGGHDFTFAATLATAYRRLARCEGAQSYSLRPYDVSDYPAEIQPDMLRYAEEASAWFAGVSKSLDAVASELERIQFQAARVGWPAAMPRRRQFWIF